MNKIAIEVEDLSKIYQLGEIGTGTISRDIERWIKINLLSQEDPFLKIGQTNDRTIKGDSNIVYSLRNINFKIEQGDAVGIIGRNGAGKSTLLKLLSRVTDPSSGNIKIKGRVASLLEVGTGFHPELTGRENIFLNGAILGMRKHEIQRKMDEMIDFSGVERYIDTPVKRYSSGMYVRLAFAVAAHLESEILIVDEVLAVGDIDFQNKCLGKMSDISKSDGRTILFVSHNMASVRELCQKGILLNNGEVEFQGSQLETISKYVSKNLSIQNYVHDNSKDLFRDQFELIYFKLINDAKSLIKISSLVEFEALFKFKVIDKNLNFNIEIKNSEEIVVFYHAYWIFSDNNSGVGNYKLRISVPPSTFNAGNYKVNIIWGENKSKAYLKLKDIIFFQIENEPLAGSFEVFPGVTRPSIQYSFEVV
jgi:lipopolysaccharide transport system ATP-binding protein